MKIAVCTICSDFVAPRRDRAWRWCQCEGMGVRWGDPDRGLLEVTSRLGDGFVWVLGLNNQFLLASLSGGARDLTRAEWREMHDRSCQDVPANYLFHADQRNCWAVSFPVGETGDVTFVGFSTAVDSPAEDLAVRAPDAL